MLLVVSILAPALLLSTPLTKATTTYTFTPAKDSFTNSGSANTNYGTEAFLNSGVSGALDNYRSYLTFNTSSVTSNSSLIVSATLKLYVNTAPASRTYNVSVVYDAWTEAALTWNNQPSNYGDSVTETVSSTGWWSVDVTSLFSSNATLSFRVKDATEDTGDRLYQFSSKEGSNDPVLEVIVESGVYFYNFHGVYDESDGEYLGACNVTAYFESSAAVTFEVDSDKIKAFTEEPLFFVYDLEPYSREYWVNDLANNTDLYIYNDPNSSSYVINFLDYTGILASYPYVEAQVNVNGESVIVEKRKIDSLNSVYMTLTEGRKYQITISGEDVTHTYGDLLMTSDTGVQLVLGSVRFPTSNLLTQKNIHCYAQRNYTSTSITTIFEDEDSQTASVDIDIYYRNGTLAYTDTETAQTFSNVWNSASNDTYYFVIVTIHNSVYGDLEYRMPFGAENESNEVWSLSWLGSLDFNTAYLIPALILILAAACFSVLNAEVGAVLTVITAIVLTVLGWIPIPAGALVSALFLSVLMALVYNKRRVMY